MKQKKFFPTCYHCGGRKHRRRPDGSRWCPHFGCLPSGRFLDQAGRPTTYEQRAAVCERVKQIRITSERREARAAGGLIGLLRCYFDQAVSEAANDQWKVFERSEPWQDRGGRGLAQLYIARWMASLTMLARSLRSMIGAFRSAVIYQRPSSPRSTIKSHSIPRPVLRRSSPASAISGEVTHDVQARRYQELLDM